MKKLTFLIMAAITIAGCTKAKTHILSLEKNEITVRADGRWERVKVKGAERDICNVIIEDEFVVNAIGETGGFVFWGENVGETTLKISTPYSENTVECKVKVRRYTDCVGDIIPMFGARKREVSKHIGRNEYVDSQRGCSTYTYSQSGGYEITDRYYYKNEELFGIHKIIKTYPGEPDSSGKILRGLQEYMRKTGEIGNNNSTYSHPSGYYAAQYVTFNPNGNGSNTHNIYFATTLNDAIYHSFAK